MTDIERGRTGGTDTCSATVRVGENIGKVMPRQARESSGTGIYHVMMRGINHQTISFMLTV